MLTEPRCFTAGDAKYRRVRMSNARFNSALGVRTGGVACMESVGFRKEQEGSDWFLVMDAVPPELQQVRRCSISLALSLSRCDEGALKLLCG